ncbi:McKusick-Kaufman/Bardet-Biedl syndromes putative chaperonin, partial [Geodia barretti]
MIDFEASSDGQREIEDFGASREEWKEVESVVLKGLMRLAVHLVEAGVRFVGCQKVVHPLIKDYWRQEGVYVADRLSSLSLGPVRELTGGKIIGSLSPNLSSDSLGRLSSIRHTTVHG